MVAKKKKENIFDDFNSFIKQVSAPETNNDKPVVTNDGLPVLIPDSSNAQLDKLNNTSSYVPGLASKIEPTSQEKQTEQGSLDNKIGVTKIPASDFNAISIINAYMLKMNNDYKSIGLTPNNDLRSYNLLQSYCLQKTNQTKPIVVVKANDKMELFSKKVYCDFASQRDLSEIISKKNNFFYLEENNVPVIKSNKTLKHFNKDAKVKEVAFVINYIIEQDAKTLKKLIGAEADNIIKPEDYKIKVENGAINVMQLARAYLVCMINHGKQ